ncbi:hypothetical protein CBM2595_A30584 [Cupriavidus taiwanensis]|nr:hypothetical protein CBM2595_A30584 [Cupriavidus taiwanensis]
MDNLVLQIREWATPSAMCWLDGFTVAAERIKQLRYGGMMQFALLGHLGDSDSTQPCPTPECRRAVPLLQRE